MAKSASRKLEFLGTGFSGLVQSGEQTLTGLTQSMTLDEQEFYCGEVQAAVWGVCDWVSFC